MSMRTIVEFNHDYAHKIDVEMIGWLRRALASGDSRDWEPLESYGIRRAVMAHHSAARKAVVEGRDFPLS